MIFEKARFTSQAEIHSAKPEAARSAGGHSATDSPEPPNSAGKSFSLGSPSFIGSTVSA
jgi:hypothetical protein